NNKRIKVKLKGLSSV
ncbi:hypothetical protein ACXOKN_02670, partial [Streptococcus thermophilus]